MADRAPEGRRRRRRAVGLPKAARSGAASGRSSLPVGDDARQRRSVTGARRLSRRHRRQPCNRRRRECRCTARRCMSAGAARRTIRAGTSDRHSLAHRTRANEDDRNRARGACARTEDCEEIDVDRRPGGCSLRLGCGPMAAMRLSAARHQRRGDHHDHRRQPERYGTDVLHRRRQVARR